MQSNNPVFRRSAEFNGSSAQQYPTYPGQPQGGPATASRPYGTDPASWDVARGGLGQGPASPTGPAAPTAPMTIDSTVQKTAMSVGTVILVAMATWVLTPDMGDTDPSPLFAAVMIGSLGAFALSLVNSFKRVISPALVLAFAALEGVALGALSKIFESSFGGVVAPAVFGTFAAFAGTLAAYKFFDITVTDKFRRGVMAAVFGMVALSLMEVVLGFFGNSFGLFGLGGLGMVFSLAGLALGIFMLILDFDFVEQGVRYGLPERESWRAAFAMTVSLVWIYTNLLRLMAIFNQD
jgi:uncharacterized YccA/Bax inhibitor family protein